MKLTSISELDLTRPEVPYPNYIQRSWKEEIIYFIMVDRFHDGEHRTIQPGPAAQKYQKEDLMTLHGGTFRGIQSQLNYVKNLGCTTLWLSPVFENYEESYHGYAIRNFLNTDPRFGTIDELKELVSEAHKIGIRIVLDVVINHTANTWSYEKEEPVYTGSAHRFGHWRDGYYPIPRELRNPDYYKKAGAIRNWDEYPETQEGDIFELKKLTTDTSPVGKDVLEILVKIYSFWIKETNVDGFRLDTVKHLTPSAVALFCTKIREYARYLGKDSFMIFGEAVGDYSLMSNYLRTVKIQESWTAGLDAALDFPLHFVLDDIVKGKRPASELYKLYRSSTRMLAKLNKKTSDLIVFADNHDQIGQEHKSRIAYEAEEDQIVATIGLLYFLYGIPCLYYGTEQLLEGNGTHDCWVREPMFRKQENISLHSVENALYQKIAGLALLRKKMSLFREAALEIDLISVDGRAFLSCEHTNEVLYWSKRVFEEKMIVLYNPKKTQKQSICAKLSSNRARIKSSFEYVYGNTGEVKIEVRENCGYINIDLNPLQFVILK